jgi:6-pyruvoyltetrahydropterin/6-carboxytetrahydropterin synthase
MHRIPRHESKCAAFHGHRYAAELECWAEALDDRGRVVDFGVIKERVGGWIDQHWDHTAIFMRGDPDPAIPIIVASNAAFGRPVYFLDVPPTAENIAAVLAETRSTLAEANRALERGDKLIGSEAIDQRLASVQAASDALIDKVFWRAMVVVGLLVGGLVLVTIIRTRRGGA